MLGVISREVAYAYLIKYSLSTHSYLLLSQATLFTPVCITSDTANAIYGKISWFRCSCYCESEALASLLIHSFLWYNIPPFRTRVNPTRVALVIQHLIMILKIGFLPSSACMIGNSFVLLIL
jgi:hypothetical protein